MTISALLKTSAAVALFSASAVVIGCSSGPGPGPQPPNGGNACKPDSENFNATKVQGQVKPHIVRIVAGKSTGTGFRLKTSSKEVLIVTNHHVIADGEEFKAIIPTDGGKNAEIGGLEVVKVDYDNDLALLKAPAIAGGGEGLVTFDAGVQLGQRVAAMGYPYVAGSDEFTLTFEPGDVSAVSRKIKEREYVQTNANINPGNSGGPVVDACANVIGVVVATSTKAERVGLVVPVKKLVALQKQYAAPPLPPKQAITSQINKLEKAVRFRKGKDAAALFSRGFVRRVVMPDFLKYVERAKAKEAMYAEILANLGKDYYRAPLEERAKFLRNELPRAEFEAWLWLQLLRQGTGIYEAMGGYLSMWVPDVFGDVRSIKVEDVSDVTDESGVALLKINTSRGDAFWEFEMVREWGDWRIDKVTCKRGC